MAIKLISVDVDGTLVDENKRSHPSVGPAIRAALASGIQICLNSGRGLRELDFIVERFGIPGPYICSNGGVIHDGKRVLWGDFLDPKVLLEFLSFGWEHGANMIFTGAESTYFCSPIPLFRSFTAIQVVGRDTMEQMINAGAGFFMMAIHAEDPDPFDRLCELWEQNHSNPDLEAAKTFRTILGITKRGVNKGSAMLRLARLLGISPEEILAIGDNDNDIEMIRLAGFGVAMGSAPNAVKQAADAVTGTVRDGGAATAIWRYALQKPQPALL